jgi:hypothetical protein
MAITALSIPVQEGLVQHLMFSTIPTQMNPEVLGVTIYQCNEEFVPQKVLQTTIDKRSEEQYHTELREVASKKNHFVKGHSTNPEWNENLENGKD